MSFESVDTMNKTPGLQYGTAFVIGACGIVFVGTLFAVGGALLPTQALTPPQTWTGRLFYDYYRLFIWSSLLTIIAAALFTAMHYNAQKLHEAVFHRECPPRSIAAVPGTAPIPPTGPFQLPGAK